MNRCFFVPAFALLSILLLLGGCAKTTTQIDVGSFELDPSQTKKLHSWFPTTLAKTKEFVQFKWDDEIVHTGDHSVSISINPDHPDDVIFYNWTRSIPEFKIGQKYELSGWVKTESLKDSAAMMIQCWNFESKEVLKFVTTERQHPVTGTTDWTEVGTVFTVPEGTSTVRIRAGISTPINRGGQVWFDDIHVREVKTDTTDVMQGTWTGTLDAGMKLRLTLNVESSKWLVTLDSVDQGAFGLIVSNLKVDGDQVGFELKQLNASFSGTLVDQDHIDGHWVQGIQLPLNFERTTEAPQLLRPQEPKEPFPYSTEEVSYSFDPDNIEKTLISGTSSENDAMITLSGTLTIPPGDRPHPCVLLISGSGPQDRDETLMNHKPFWVLADHLSRHGIAVLRVDDRGTRKSTGNFSTATSEDFAKDASAGFLFLKEQKSIDSARVALLGHSEGGLIAPLVAANYSDVAAIVLMAGPGVDGREVLLLQTELMLKARMATQEQIDQYLTQQIKILDILGADLPEDEFATRMDAHLKENYEELSVGEQKSLGSLENYIQTVGAQLKTPWMQWFVRYDPAPTLSNVFCPVLAVNGSKDLQVDAEQNIPAIEAALKAGHNTNFKTVVLPGLNHLFQHCETGSMAEYGVIEETLAPEFLDVVTQWLQKQLEKDSS